MNKWKQLPKEEMIPLRQHMIAVALKSIIKTSFGNDYFKTNKDILEFQAAYIVVCLNFYTVFSSCATELLPTMLPTNMYILKLKLKPH